MVFFLKGALFQMQSRLVQPKQTDRQIVWVEKWTDKVADFSGASVGSENDITHSGEVLGDESAQQKRIHSESLIQINESFQKNIITRHLTLCNNVLFCLSDIVNTLGFKPCPDQA